MTEFPFVFSSLEDVPPSLLGAAISIGNFDGVHLGHVEIMRHLRATASARLAPTIALTFDPHPIALLRPSADQPALTTIAQKAKILRGLGIDALIHLPINREFLNKTAQEFFDEIVRTKLRAVAMIEGADFRFGRNRMGNVESLSELCNQAGMEFHAIPPLEIDGAPVSSTRIRRAILEGDMLTAAKCLGRSYTLEGVVGTGAKRGRLLGFPTANLEHAETVVPGYGVYATFVTLHGIAHSGVTNVGPNPTFGEDTAKVEAHIFDFDQNVYGEPIEIDFVKQLRGIKRFDSMEALKQQILADVQQSKDTLRQAR